MWQRFSLLGLEASFDHYKDVSEADSGFDLTLLDCWRGLFKGKSVGFVEQPPDVGHYLWGLIDIEEYEHDDSPLNGDFHLTVPDEFVSFRGPVDLPALFRDSNGSRVFSPAFYADTFLEMGVTAVIRLNEDNYDAGIFEEKGIAHYDLEFADCTVPPEDIVSEFFRIVDSTGGVVAIHCKVSPPPHGSGNETTRRGLRRARIRHLFI